VGVSHECDHPPEVVGLPVLTRSRTHDSASSRVIDGSVRDVLGSALAVYELETDLLERLRPDVIVTQDLCDVCAVSFADVSAAVRRLVHEDVVIVNLHPERLEDIWADIRKVALHLERQAEGEALLAGLQRRVEDVRVRAAALPGRPKVLAVEWLDPVMIGGLWMPDLIGIAGGRTLVAAPGLKAATVNRADLARLAPDVVVVKPCGFTLPRVLSELGTLRESLPWSSWEAVARGRVYLVDGNAYFNRPGPRITDSLEILAACLHPAGFPDHALTYRSSVVRVDRDLGVHPFQARA
jgi:iron complex transport system substrate-binding protein